MSTNQIKFDSVHNTEFIKELRSEVKNYFKSHHISKFGNANIIYQSLFMIALYFIPYALMLSGWINSPAGIVLCWAFMGLGMAGLGMVMMHDANHGSFSRNPRINNFLGKSLYLLGGFPPNWKFQHNTLHHGYTNIEGHDEDIGHDGILRFSPHKPHYKIHSFQHWYAWLLYGLMTLSWVTLKDFNKLAQYKRMNAALSGDNNYRKLWVDLIAGKIIYYAVFLVIPIIVLPISWYWTVLLFLMMHFISGFTLSLIFQTAHVMPTSEYPLPDENGNMDNNWAIHQLLTTSDYAPNSRFFSWFIGGLNYQIEHHLFPNISHVHYKKIAPIVRRVAEKHNLPYHVQPSFRVAVIHHMNMLKSLGKKDPTLN